MTREEALERLEETAKKRAFAMRAQMEYEESNSTLLQDMIEEGVDDSDIEKKDS